jgi:hypothetical protein
MGLDARLDYRISSHLQTIKRGHGWTTGFEGSPQSEMLLRLEILMDLQTCS